MLSVSVPPPCQWVQFSTGAHRLPRLLGQGGNSSLCRTHHHMPSCAAIKEVHHRTVEGSLAVVKEVIHQQVEDSLASTPRQELQQSSITEEKAWDASHTADLFRINAWGHPYFSINNQGHACVRPLGSSDGLDELDLVELVEALKRRNVRLPMVIRFSDILEHRLHELQNCFDLARQKFGYKNRFQGVFPIKCNHDRHLLDDIVRSGQQFDFGLEAGSKPELLIAIAKLMRSRDALLICNGYKDQVYIESVLLARKLNVNAIVVLEQMEELDLVIKSSQILGVRPVIGVRAKLSTQHSGHWGSTSGEDGKFGLTVNELVKVVYTLRRQGMLDCLQLLHFHIGSQLSSISTIKEAMREGSHIYCELALMGAPMGYIDVGGGLGIDYDGTKSQSFASTNYSMQNYANDVVAALVDACILKGVPQPVIVSESGRALASHQSILVFDVLSTSQRSESSSLRNLELLAENGTIDTVPSGDQKKEREISNGTPHSGRQDPGKYLLSTFHEVYNALDEHNFHEGYNDAKQFKLEVERLFKLGGLSLEQRAQADALYDAICHRLLASFEESVLPDELKELKNSFAAIYHINLSVFRSIPDTWAIGQVFPIMPLQRLNERPDLHAVLADLTCDSDGKIDRFIGDNGKFETVLPVHRLRSGEPYYIGLFLAGVYQEVMGSAHNLFGGTNVVYIKAKPAAASGHGNRQRGGYTVEHVKWGDSMREILGTVQHAADDLLEEFRREAEDGVTNGQLTLEAAQALLANYQCCLNSYTYLT